MAHLNRMRLDRGAQHLHSLGARAVAEVAGTIGGAPCILHVLAELKRLTPGMMHASGADRPMRYRLRAVPR